MSVTLAGDRQQDERLIEEVKSPFPKSIIIILGPLVVPKPLELEHGN